jgi:hypothetical protein
MVKNTLAFEAAFEGEESIMVNFSWPASNEEILAAVKAQLDLYPGQIFAASFSHIVSVPGAILPAKVSWAKLSW